MIFNDTALLHMQQILKECYDDDDDDDDDSDTK